MEDMMLIDEIVDEVMVTEEVPEVIITAIGVVANCKKLNIRKSPSVDAEVVTVVPEGTELQIDPETSTDEWYSVCTVSGVEGFCMVDYVEI